MNIALLGYGKMGKVLEEEALKRGHQIGLIITSKNAEILNLESLKDIDMALEFSSPKTVVNNIYHCFDAGVPVVVGTTGWLEHWNLVVEDARCRNQAFFYASNFSLGVNLFFQLNAVLAKMMNEFPEYEASIKEIHHRAKKDSPSGTAITLAEIILKNIPRIKSWVNEKTMENLNSGNTQTSATSNPEKLVIQSVRMDPYPGTNEILYSSKEDEIEIRHTAKNRNGFAQGAIFAAEYLLGKKGVYTMNDLINFSL